MEDSTGPTTYTYNASNILETVTYPGGKTITYSYDANNNRETLTDPDGGVTTYSYTARNQVAAMENAFNELTTFAYDDVGRAITQQNHNGTWVSYTYDDAGRLSQLVNLKSDNSTLSSFAYSLDDVGNRIGVTEANGDVVTWSYDDAYQLTRERRSGTNAYDVTYSYDAVGNRLTKEEGGATTTYSYDAANQIETEETPAQVTTYTFDDNGNTSVVNADGDLSTYTWDVENMLTQVALPDASTATFTYDGDKRRRSKTEGGTATNFIRDGERVLLETNSGGTTQAQYTLRGGGWFDSLIAMRRSGASSFYHFDALGSTDRLSDEDEDVTDSYLYKAFGQIAASSGATINPFRYVGDSGYYRDTNTGLLQLGVRYYIPSAGRFASIDPMKQGQNYYSYVGSNPTGRRDATGKWWEWWPWRKPYCKALYIYVNKHNNLHIFNMTDWNRIESQFNGQYYSHQNLGVRVFIRKNRTAPQSVKEHRCAHHIDIIWSSARWRDLILFPDTEKLGEAIDSNSVELIASNIEELANEWASLRNANIQWGDRTHLYTNIVIHEISHALGLKHHGERGTCIMSSLATYNFLEPLYWDRDEEIIKMRRTLDWPVRGPIAPTQPTPQTNIDECDKQDREKEEKKCRCHFDPQFPKNDPWAYPDPDSTE